MKAIRIHGSSGKATVSLDEIAIPEAGPGEVLIRVHATAVTPGELEWYPTWHTPKGEPRTYAVPCHEFSDVIEEIDPDSILQDVDPPMDGVIIFLQDFKFSGRIDKDW
jgi:NADPH:quinone reductase-like Zn-dependent oxidoreductase